MVCSTEDVGGFTRSGSYHEEFIKAKKKKCRKVTTSTCRTGRKASKIPETSASLCVEQ